MSIFLKLVSAAFYVMLFQNLIFNGGYGITEAVRMSAKPRQLLPTAFFVTYFSLIASAVCALLDTLEPVRVSGDISHAAVFSAVLLALYLLTVMIVLFIGRISEGTLRIIGISSFNTLVFAVPLISYRSAFTVSQALGAGIGAGAAYVIAVLMVNWGLRTLDADKSIPGCFRGTPAIFIYVSLLSMAFAGISGTAVVV